jgi:ATP-dependent exoDNAse (exonuclease V) alpha subunit
MPESLAYIVPQSEDRGDMYLLPEGDKHTYRLGDYGPSEIDYGLFDVDYSIYNGSRGNRTYDIYYLNEADRTVPQNYEVLRSALESITGFADKLMMRIGQGEDMDSVFSRLRSREWLEETHGIGPSHSESLVEKFESIIPEGLEVFSAFRQHDLPYARSNQREEWAYAYFDEYEEELEAFRENPYHLVRIGDSSRRNVRRLERQRPDLNAASYPIRWIDERVEGWDKSHERVVAYLETSLSGIFRQGHTVATAPQIAEALRDEGLNRVEFWDEGTLQQKRTDRHLVEALIEDTESTQKVSFVDPDGRKHTGVTGDSYYHQARTITSTINWLGNKGTPFAEPEIKKMIGWANQSAPVELDQSQQTAIRYAFHSAISAITGAAGTGKTTTLGSILSGCAPLLESRKSQMAFGSTDKRTAFCVYVTAPTGKATQRARKELDIENPETGEPVVPGPIDSDEMPEKQRFLEQGHLQVGTLHSMLGFQGHSFTIPEPHPSVIVVDESSMMDLELAFNLMQYVKNCLENDIPVWVLLSGDIEQLPPVGSGYPYRDFLVRASGPTVASTELDRIHRQDDGSGIVEAAFQLANGEMPPLPSEGPDDFFWHAPPDGEIDPWTYVQNVAQRANERENLGASPEDVQLILPLRHPSSIDKEALCMIEANERLQEVFADHRGATLRKLPACKPEDPDYSWLMTLSEGDRVVHNGRNRYYGHSPELEPINRGTIGWVEDIDEDGVVQVNYETCAELVTYEEPEDRGQLGLAYAMTCHVAQGSEFPVTGVALPKEGAPTLMTRSWLITAVTRASEFCDLMGTPNRVEMCATNNKAAWRQTNLSQM